MNGGVLAGVFGAMVVAGLVGAGWALVERPSSETVRPALWRPPALLHRLPRRTVVLLTSSIAAGLVLSAVTGWLVAVLVVPAATLGLPYLLSAPPAETTIRRLEAMDEWTRSLAGVLGAGVGLEQAIGATLRSTPEAIRPEVARLVARLRARWDTEAALKAFADELDDVTGDLIAANLILAARRRSRSLAGTLQAVAESVTEDVASRRRVEAGRAKPRGSARLVTMFSAGVLVVLAFTGDYVAPYRTPLGQVLLVVLLAAYAAGLWWMRKMAEAKPPPRILGPAARAGAS